MRRGARGVVFATGMHTELGRIASMSQRVEVEKSPLEREVRRLSRLIAAIAVTLAIAFVPVAHFGAADRGAGRRGVAGACG